MTPTLSRASRRLVWSVGVLMGVLLAVSLTAQLPPLQAWTRESVWYELLQDSVYLLAAALVGARAVLAGRSRPAWAILSVGLLSYGLGNVVYYAVVQHLDPEPYPSAADALWLVLYPLLYTSAVLLLRGQVRQWQRSFWLDGLVAGLGTACVVVALLLEPVLGLATTGSRTAVALNLAYPVCDLLLLVMVAIVFAATGWRPGARWWLLGLGMATFAIADSVYLLDVAHGSVAGNTWVDNVWLVGVIAMALAPWVKPPARLAAVGGGVRLLAVPMLFASAALGVLAWESLQLHDRSVLVTVLSAATIVTALWRTSMSFSEVRALGDAQHLARTDDLTGLPNRRQLLEQIDRALEVGPRVAVLLIDLDRFKEVNDSFGHHVGDDLLRLVSSRLENAMPGRGLLARMGGDEFGALLPGADEATAVAVAAAIRSALAAPVALAGLELYVEASTGVALAPAHGTDAATLLRHADVAMYEAKRDRQAFVVFSEALHGGARSRLETVAQLRSGLAGGELVLHYQPQLSLVDGAVAGVEALVRWQHPDRGLLYPDAFLDLAEHAGLMTALVDRVLGLALADVAGWRAVAPDLTVSVNLSASNLQDLGLPGRVAARLADFGLPASALTLEITENVLMADARTAQAVLEELRGLGIRLSVDDYGTGYSSLGYLRELPVHEVKLDKVFVGSAVVDARSAAIVRSTIDLARALGTRLVAEGVEDAAALALLEAWGCDVAQGYYIARPMPGALVAEWLARRPSVALV